VRGADKLVAAAGRLTERVSAWDEDSAVAFAEDCAGRVQQEISGLLERAGSARAASEYAAAAGECLGAPPFKAFEAAAGAAYVAALAAAQAGGAAARLAERREQAGWLGRELALEVERPV